MFQAVLMFFRALIIVSCLVDVSLRSSESIRGLASRGALGFCGEPWPGDGLAERRRDSRKCGAGSILRGVLH